MRITAKVKVNRNPIKIAKSIATGLATIKYSLIDQKNIRSYTA